MLILASCFSDSDKDVLIRAQREAPLGMVKLTIYEDRSFIFEFTGLRSQQTTLFKGQVEYSQDSLFFKYNDSIPGAGKIAVFDNNSIRFIAGDYPESFTIVYTGN
jgi:hypothetical protein